MTSGGLHDRGFRDDVQALRAVAVLAVVSAHVLGWPSGGFLGVDVFFVISGFLITKHLLEREGTPGAALLDFYRRRARRILPAAVLVITAVVLASHLLFPSGRVDRVSSDALWSLLFGANIHFGLQGTDYFDATGPESPLQHYWSLAVEEQFYLVWPLLLLTTLYFLRPSTPESRRRIGLRLALVVSLASFIWSWLVTKDSPVSAYFSTPARAWEIGAGAILAAIGSRLGDVPHPVRQGLALVGLGGILVAVVVIDPGSPVPTPAAALPVLGAMAFIAGGARVDEPLLAHRWLVNPTMLRVGALSFSLYLWHWPVQVFLEGLIDSSAMRAVLSLVVTYGLSELSYTLVEQRFLRGSRERRAVVQRWAVFAIVSTTVLVATVPGALLRGDPTRAAASTSADTDDLPQLSGDPAQKTAQLTEALQAAMAAEEFPTLVPTLEDPFAGIFEAMNNGECLNPHDHLERATCTYEAPEPNGRTALIIGDSVATSWLPGVIRALGPDGWNVRAVTFSSCPPALVSLELNDKRAEEECAQGLAAAMRIIAEQRPDLVIGSTHQGSLPAVRTTAGGPDQWTSFITGLAAVGQQIRATGAGYVLLGPGPAGPAPLECGGALARPRDCVTLAQGDFDAMIAAFGAAATAGGFGYVDTTGWFCTPEGCPVFAAGRLTRWDTAHMTRQYVEYLAPLLHDSLLVHVPEPRT